MMDYWELSPIEFTAIVKANRGDKTEEEERHEEIMNQKKMAAMLGTK